MAVICCLEMLQKFLLPPRSLRAFAQTAIADGAVEAACRVDNGCGARSASTVDGSGGRRCSAGLAADRVLQSRVGQWGMRLTVVIQASCHEAVFHIFLFIVR